ncbi:MAG: hypothetical protein ACWGN7_07815 [Thermodesulfovibrionales bacterium]
MTFIRTAALVIAFALVLLGCAPSTFIISKDGRAYYFGRESKVLRAMLCDSGDLERILSETIMPDNLKHAFLRYNCSEDRSEKKVIATYLFLNPDERKDLKSAFSRHGYVINYVPC